MIVTYRTCPFALNACHIKQMKPYKNTVCSVKSPAVTTH